MCECKECGESITRHPKTNTVQLYCSPACRRVFNNRRQLRGADLYDLFMALRYERGLAKAKGVWSLICGMGQAWREEDTRLRGARRSWAEAEESLGRAQQYRAKVVARPRAARCS